MTHWLLAPPFHAAQGENDKAIWIEGIQINWMNFVIIFVHAILFVYLFLVDVEVLKIHLI